MAMNVAETFWERRKWPDLHIIETQSSSSFNMLVEFDFLDEKLQDTISVLPPKKQTDIPENWEAPNR